MGIEENKALHRRIIDEIFNQGDMAVIPELVDEHFVYHGIGGRDVNGTEGFERMVRFVRNAFPDLHVTMEDVLTEGDKVIIRINYRGTHKGELFGVSPTNNPVNMDEIIIAIWKDGKEVEAWGILDMYTMMQQLGVIPTN